MDVCVLCKLHHQHDVLFFRWNDGSVRHVHTTFWIFKHRSSTRRHYKNETDWNQMWFFSDDQKQLADKYVICGNFGFSNATVQSNRHPHQPKKKVLLQMKNFWPNFRKCFIPLRVRNLCGENMKRVYVSDSDSDNNHITYFLPHTLYCATIFHHYEWVFMGT